MLELLFWSGGGGGEGGPCIFNLGGGGQGTALLVKGQHPCGGPGAELAKVSTSVGFQRLNWQKSAPLWGSRG